MLNKEIFCLDMFGTFGARCTTVLFKGESTHIIMKNNIFIDCLSLHFEEMTGLENVARLVMNRNKLSFRQALSINLLFVR
jgi:hypothetical protein